MFHPKETRTCYKCNEAGHISWNCTKNVKTKQGVSQKLKEKVVDVEPPTEKLKVFENSTYEVGECSKKNVIKQRLVRKSAMNLVPQSQKSHRLK